MLRRVLMSSIFLILCFFNKFDKWVQFYTSENRRNKNIFGNCPKQCSLLILHFLLISLAYNRNDKNSGKENKISN